MFPLCSITRCPAALPPQHGAGMMPSPSYKPKLPMSLPTLLPSFSARLIAWQRTDGRHDLPWQVTDPYAVWVSEIMLQQTQVRSVLDYYPRFMAMFPTVADLAHADLDHVLAHWSGLGYYSRPRNLHKAAQQVMAEHGGQLPATAAQLQTLSGIGRSTAAAIAAFSFGERAAILDGNVRRVLARAFGVAGWAGNKAVEAQLWTLAEDLLPAAADIVPYTQGLMDLGSLICTRSKPRCASCPLHADCVAYTEQRVSELPTPRPAKAIPTRETVFVLVWCGEEVWLERRPPSGIWGGLWSLPACDRVADVPDWLDQHGLTQATLLPPQPPQTHVFTHFRLHFTPQRVEVDTKPPHVEETAWFSRQAALQLGLPAPIRRLLEVPEPR
mgnify:FL=1